MPSDEDKANLAAELGHTACCDRLPTHEGSCPHRIGCTSPLANHTGECPTARSIYIDPLVLSGGADDIRRFRLTAEHTARRAVRKEDVSGVSGLGVVAVGCQYPSGRCIIEWLPGKAGVRSFNIYQSIDEIKAVNGHEGRTVIEWMDAEQATSYAAMRDSIVKTMAERLTSTPCCGAAARGTGHLGACSNHRCGEGADTCEDCRYEVGVEGDLFRPHRLNAGCGDAGCVKITPDRRARFVADQHFLARHTGSNQA